jgi:hypothetical protein
MCVWRSVRIFPYCCLVALMSRQCAVPEQLTRHPLLWRLLSEDLRALIGNASARVSDQRAALFAQAMWGGSSQLREEVGGHRKAVCHLLGCLIQWSIGAWST